MTDQEKQFVDEFVYLHFSTGNRSSDKLAEWAGLKVGILAKDAWALRRKEEIAVAINNEIHKYQDVIGSEETKEEVSRVMWAALQAYIND